MNIDEKRILTFDCYGTLIDWEKGLLDALRQIPEFDQFTEDQLLRAFGDCESVVQQQCPTKLYPEILFEVLQEMSSSFNIVTNEQRKKDFAYSICNWPPFDDTHDALSILKTHFTLVIVSNIDNQSIGKSINRMNIDFDYIYTAQEIGYYKPDQRVFHYVFDKLMIDGYQKSQILHVAQSLFHDHVPAYHLGLDSVWIDRRYNKSGSGATPEIGPMYIPSNRFISMMDFAKWVEKTKS